VTSPARPSDTPTPAESTHGESAPGELSSRQAHLTTSLGQLRSRIATACATAGRSPASVTAIIVTKTWPASDVRILSGIGVRDVGENRDQEADPKAAECADLPVRWHFIGQVQTNKARSVVRYADVVHSVDRDRLVVALDRAAIEAGRRVGVLIQVRLDDGASGLGQGGGSVGPRAGAPVGQVGELADRVAGSAALDLLGVMAVASLGADPAVEFGLLRDVSVALQARYPGATWISAGMSGDLEAAIAAGATHVRVGSAVLGTRPPLG
jgi:PLP dependent protein